MNRVFIDTSAWFAYIWPRDPNHAAVKEALEKWEGRLVTSNFVFDEFITLARARVGHATTLRAGESLKDPDVVDLVNLLPEDEEEAWEWFKRHKDKAYSFTDCTSFALMRRLHIPAAIATDRHFRQAGFEILPRV